MSKTQFSFLTGCPFAFEKNSMTAGPHGPVLLQDRVLLEKATQFAREKTPPRNVHALGCGAYGTFTVTNDITSYCSANLFSEVGKKTDIFVRFSGVFTEVGEANTFRDQRGIAIKFYTEEGNLDILCVNAPVFPCRDMKIGPDTIHALKRNPVTGEWYPTQTWDFVVNHPEGLHAAMMLYTDRGGTPASFRYMNGWAINTFSFINSAGVRCWVKYHFLAQKGSKALTEHQAKLIAGEDPDFLSKDLREGITSGDKPTWRFCVQIMKEEDAYQHEFAFDSTKVWKHNDFPLIDVGIIQLHSLPVDYHTEVEQVAFSPLNVVPGISFSPDRLLQGRLLVYDDTQHHRLGPNFKYLPTNFPKGVPPNKQHRQYHAIGGHGNTVIKDVFPHYYPSSLSKVEGATTEVMLTQEPLIKCDGDAGFYDLKYEATQEDYFGQVRDFLSVVRRTHQEANLIINIGNSLMKVEHSSIVAAVIQLLTVLDSKFGQSVQQYLSDTASGNIKKTEAQILIDLVRKDLGHSIPDIKVPMEMTVPQ